MLITLDTEYSARYAENGVAPLVCLAYETEDEPGVVHVVDRKGAVALWRRWLVDPDVQIVAHSAANDVAALTQAIDPSETPGHGPWWELAFQLYEDRRVYCTEMRARLLANALGHVVLMKNSSLAKVVAWYFDETVEGKKPSGEVKALLRESVPYADWPAETLHACPWRFKFETLIDVPLEDWPADALAYVREDGNAPRRLLDYQREQIGADRIADEVPRTQHAFNLHVLSLPGWRTDRKRAQRLLVLYRKAIGECLEVLLACGLVDAYTFHAGKPDHEAHRTETTTKMGRVQALVYQALGDEAPLNKAAIKAKLKRADLSDDDQIKKTARDRGAVSKAIIARGGTVLSFLDAVLACREGRLPAALAATHDPDLNAFRTKQYAEKLVSSFLVNFDTDRRVRTSYGALVATGRTSSRGSKTSYAINIQQQPADYDKPKNPELHTRGCVIPDEGCVFVGVDYQQLELCALGHLLSVVVRHSTGNPDYQSSLSQAINRGDDCHARVASGLMGIGYAEFLALKKAKDPEALLMRKTAKPVNFGPPGGMGARAFVDFALNSYGIVFTEAEARAAIKVWKATWFEIAEYFGMIDDIVIAGGGLATVQQLYSGRIRGSCFYTAACNSLFQGLAADGALEALRLIIAACYRRGGLPLRTLAQYSEAAIGRIRKAEQALARLRFTPWAFIHDENVGQQPDPMLAVAHDYSIPTAERWAFYREAKKHAGTRSTNAIHEAVVLRAEEGMRALSLLMVEGMRVFIPDVTIRTDGTIFPERWGK